MLWYDYDIIYEKGEEYVVVDALSYQYEDVVSLLTIPVPIPEWLALAFQEWFNDPPITHVICTLQEAPHTTTGSTYHDETLKDEGCLVLFSTSSLK